MLTVHVDVALLLILQLSCESSSTLIAVVQHE